MTPAAAAQRLTARPSAVTALSVGLALLACDGGLPASLLFGDVKASVFVTSFSFALHLAARLLGGRWSARQPAGSG